MTHKIIIGHTSESGEYEVSLTYIPPHTETPETTGAKVGRILKTLKRMSGDPDDGS